MLGTQFLGGSALTGAPVALTGSTLWIAASTTLADIPLTPNALTVEFLTSVPLQGPYLGAGPVAGAYLGAVDFSQPARTRGNAPDRLHCQCGESGADWSSHSLSAPDYLRDRLRPRTGAIATNNSTFFIFAGAGVNFGASSAPILYASSSQINLAVPPGTYSASSSLVQVVVNGVFSQPRQLSLTYQNPTLFLNIPQTFAAAAIRQGRSRWRSTPTAP